MEPLAGQPLIEGGDTAAEPFQQVSGVEIGGLAEGVNRSARYERVEASDVDLNRCRAKPDRIAFSSEEIGGQETQRVRPEPDGHEWDDAAPGTRPRRSGDASGTRPRNQPRNL